MALLILFVLIIGVPILELYVIIQVAHVIGGWQTIGLLIVESMIGAWLLKRQGLRALTRVTQAIDQGRVPGKELVDGFLILLAGALMLAPGFLTDIIGYLLLLPPTRAPVRALLVRRFKDGKHGRLFTIGASGPGFGFGTFGGGATGEGRGRFVGDFRAGGYQDVTGHDVDDEGHPDRRELGR